MCFCIAFINIHISPSDWLILWCNQSIGRITGIDLKLNQIFCCLWISCCSASVAHYILAVFGYLTHGVLILGGCRPANREGVGVDIADLSLGLSLGRALRLGLRGWRPDLGHGHSPSICPIFLPVDSCCPIDHGHTIRAHQPLEQTSRYMDSISTILKMMSMINICCTNIHIN